MAITVITLQENSINKKLTIQDGGKKWNLSNILHGLI